MSDAQTSNTVDADLQKIVKVGRGKRDLILAAALVVVAILIGAVWFGFRGSGSHVSQGAAALTAPVPPATPKTAPRPTPP